MNYTVTSLTAGKANRLTLWGSLRLKVDLQCFMCLNPRLSFEQLRDHLFFYGDQDLIFLGKTEINFKIDALCNNILHLIPPRSIQTYF